MPQYLYRCLTCDHRVAVIRSIKSYDVKPDPEESGVDCFEGPHTWERQVGAPAVVKGRGWGGGKGAWLVLLAAGVSAWALLSLLGCHVVEASSTCPEAFEGMTRFQGEQYCMVRGMHSCQQTATMVWNETCTKGLWRIQPKTVHAEEPGNG